MNRDFNLCLSVSVQGSQNRTRILRIRQIYADFKNFFVFLYVTLLQKPSFSEKQMKNFPLCLHSATMGQDIKKTRFLGVISSTWKYC